MNISGSLEVELEKNYNELKFVLGEHTSKRMEDITVFEFYSLVEHLKSKQKTQAK